MTITTGEATIRLLGRYGIDTVFGIPGVHTLDFCRGLGTGAAVRHIHTRHEQGAGLMADGYARATGRVGVALTISGPGVTNAATALGQAYADSVPLLLISADADSRTLGKGWGVLHEVTDLNAVTRPLTGLSACARAPSDVPELIGQAFTLFASARPRPVHISIPIDVLTAHVADDWQPVSLPGRPLPQPSAIAAASELLRLARRPVLILGGGAAGAAAPATALADRLGAITISSNAGKGVVPDGHPMSLSAAMSRPEVHRLLVEADVILAVGTELSETDSGVERLDIRGRLIRIDIDPRKMNDRYPADVPVVSDAAPALQALVDALGPGSPADGGAAIVAGTRAAIAGSLGPSEARHARLLSVLRSALPAETVVFGDTCQLAYTAAFALPVESPRLWHYGAGYCTLGPALPGAIGAKLARPEAPVAVLIGDGGLMFTVQELVTAAENGLALPVILWENAGLKQIRDDMRSRNVPRIGVDGINPDFLGLARAMHCATAEPGSAEAFAEAVTAALDADRPTLILVHEDDDWLQ